MAKKLGPQEIRAGVLSIFNENGEFFAMKEVESVGRTRGISQKSVKDMVQSLVNEKIIETAKIGTVSYYWILPSNNTELRKAKLEELKDTNSKLKDKVVGLEKEIENRNNSKGTPVDEAEDLKREQLTKELKELKAKEKELVEILNAFTPSTSSEILEMEKIEKYIKPLTNAVNRWTDNVLNSVEWTKKKLNMDNAKLIYKECKIPENLDYLN